jgi:hypothetical protein
MGKSTLARKSVSGYAVAYVGDDALPEGVDWVFIAQGGTLVFAVKEQAVSAELLADAWGAFREIPALASV